MRSCGPPTVDAAEPLGQLQLHLVGSAMPFRIVISLNEPVIVPSMLAPLSPQIQKISVLSSSPISSIESITRPTLWSAFSGNPA